MEPGKVAFDGNAGHEGIIGNGGKVPGIEELMRILLSWSRHVRRIGL